jgi:hypothetical protein
MRYSSPTNKTTTVSGKGMSSKIKRSFQVREFMSRFIHPYEKLPSLSKNSGGGYRCLSSLSFYDTAANFYDKSQFLEYRGTFIMKGT